MTYLEAALQVLRSAKRPLMTREITEQAIKIGLISPQGKTPNATMSAVLYKALNAHRGIAKLGDSDSYVRARRGTVRWTILD
jgi:restriction system protein